MSAVIEHMPTKEVLATCCDAWGVSQLVFIRKMENIVYSGVREGERVFLRLTTPLRRSREQVLAELDFMNHLKDADISVPSVIINHAGEASMTIVSDKGQYEAVLFSEIKGEHPTKETLISKWYLESVGALIAKMHLISQKYRKDINREQWHVERGLRHALEATATTSDNQMHAKLLDKVEWIQKLVKTDTTYGLIHLDVTSHNVFVRDSKLSGVIDFDDLCFHFFIFDLAIVIFSIKNHFESSEIKCPEEWILPLVAGYKTIRPISDEEIAQIPDWIEFASLRLYFWIEYHEMLNTFHEEQLFHIKNHKKLMRNRVLG